MNSHSLKTLAAACIAPPLAGILVTPFLGPKADTLVVAIPVSMGILATLVIGVPVHIGLLANGRTSCASYVIAGSLCGIACAVLGFMALTSILPRAYYDDYGELWVREDSVPILGMAVFVGIGIVLGATNACFFWHIRRPDLD